MDKTTKVRVDVAATTKSIVIKLDELKDVIAALKVNDTLSKATRGTQLYARGRERRVLHLVLALVNQVPADRFTLTEEDESTLSLITSLAADRVKRSIVEIHEGDKIMDVLQKYADVKEIAKKIQVQCDKLGLHMDYTTGLISK